MLSLQRYCFLAILKLQVSTVNVINNISQKPSNIKRISWPSEKQDFPDNKNYIPAPDGSRFSFIDGNIF